MLCEKNVDSKVLTYNNLGCYYKKSGKIKQANDYLRQALALDGDNPNTHLNLCAVLS